MFMTMIINFITNAFSFNYPIVGDCCKAEVRHHRF